MVTKLTVRVFNRRNLRETHRRRCEMTQDLFSPMPNIFRCHCPTRGDAATVRRSRGSRHRHRHHRPHRPRRTRPRTCRPRPTRQLRIRWAGLRPWLGIQPPAAQGSTHITGPGHFKCTVA